MAGLFRKLFRIGKLPADMRAGVDSEGVIYLATRGCSRRSPLFLAKAGAQ